MLRAKLRSEPHALAALPVASNQQMVNDTDLPAQDPLTRCGVVMEVGRGTGGQSRQKCLDDYNSETRNWGWARSPICTRNLCAEGVLVAGPKHGLRLSQPREPVRTSVWGPPSCAGYAGC